MVQALLPVFAFVPILTILILMLGLRWSAARAGLVGVSAALALAWGVFGIGRRGPAPPGVAAATGGALLEALFTAVTILWIIFPALCIHQLQLRTGAVDVLRRAMGRLSADPRVVVLLIAWFFALFIEGAAGFGTPIALGAPLLVSLGFRPIVAVTVVLIGHAAGVSFGAVGTPIVPQVEATGFSPVALSRAAGLYHGLLGWILLFAAVRIAARATPDPVAGRQRAPRGIWLLTALAAALFLLPFTLISRYVGPELPTLGGALVGLAAFVFLLRRFPRLAPAAAPVDLAPPDPRALSLLRSTAPYLALIGLVLFTRLFGPVRRALSGLAWEWTLFGHFRGSIAPLYQPGTLLLLAFFAAILVQRAPRSEARAAAAQASRQLVPVVVALVAMLGLARVMVHAGMIDALAEAAAAGAGRAWPLLAPSVGALGTFVTGSATASNILFTDLQQATAQNVDLPVLVVVGAQSFGAAVGNIICPHNIIAGGATVGLGGEEGAVLRRTLPICALYVAAGGLVALLLAR